MTELEKLQQRGIRRLGTPRSGFRYRTADGQAVPAKEVERIRLLRIPPAWKHVSISPSRRANLQAVGQDAKGRWQYRYDPKFLERRQQAKYERLVHFARALPQLRQTVHRDLMRDDSSRECVMACIVRILATCFMRPGGQVYAKENGSFGIATLRPKHVKVKGNTVRFEFPGKSGQWQEREMTDRDIARTVRRLLKVPGKEVFKYRDENGVLVDVKRRHINDYIKEVTGERFTAKDFRTWAGTLLCACALAQVPLPEVAGHKDRKRAVVAAVKKTAEQLGNTPAICRSSYIYPSVLSAFDRGEVLTLSPRTVPDEPLRGNLLMKAEKSLLHLLGGDSPRSRTRGNKAA
jgi:DNA topoisomerase-1